MAALIPIGIAANDFDTVIASYIVDVYGSYSASAFASVTWTRAVMSVVFSLVTEELFGELGNNGAASLCAAGAVVVCVGVGALVRYGESFRERSTFAARFGGEGDGGGEAGGPARGHVTASSGLSGAC